MRNAHANPDEINANAHCFKNGSHLYVSALGFKATMAYEECIKQHEANFTQQFGTIIVQANHSCVFKEFLQGVRDLVK
ncbi:hypothetical protein DPMN_172657 [Dreissena polymorpha]|uniref:Uncharacterized protein n=1 Tax=Dreissena polymorpha TaxID=45954 RepID=A0A9D4E085_DREPO|nr:hypothetical protein DPMN_172657 [Dreissena polymorpha]